MKHSSKKYWIVSLIMLVFLVLAIHPALAASSMRTSVDSSWVEGNSYSAYPAISSDGRYVAFVSWATNLVSGDTNHYADVYLRDTQSGITTLISVDSDEVQANNRVEGNHPAISADGRFVAFASRASNLVIGDTNDAVDVFVRDALNSTTERVSVNSSGLQGDNESVTPSISADGRYVAFRSDATNLVSGDTNSSRDVFVHDRQSGTTTRVSVNSAGTQGNGDSGSEAISANGQYIAFMSHSSNLVSGDTNFVEDIFVRDTLNGTTTRVSVSSSEAQSNNVSHHPDISVDGRYITFYSHGNNLVSGDTNGATDIFLRDTLNGTTTRISVSSSEEQTNNYSFFPVISDDGRYVAFNSDATNLVSGDTNGARDVFVRDTQGGTTIRVSVDSSGAQANYSSYESAISGNGLYVSYTSDASNLIFDDTNGVKDVFVSDYSTITVSLDPASWDFGTQAVGSTSGSREFTLQNNSPMNIVIGTLGASGDYALSSNLCNGQTLVPSGTCSFEATFAPVDVGVRFGSVSIPIENRLWPEIVELRGTGLNSPPSIDILSIFSDSGSLFSQIDLADPEDDPISGSVKIILYPNLPTTVTFETLSCSGTDPAELWLNGELVGTNPRPADCSCSPGVTASVFNGAVITDRYLIGENNAWAFNQADLTYTTATAWARASIIFSDGNIQNACMFDATGTGCTTTDLCTGYVWGPISVSSVQPTAEQVLAAQSYSHSTLPVYLDTSGISPGNYTLLATAMDDFHLPAHDTQVFTANNELRLYINTKNSPPLLTPIGNKEIDELSTLVFTATATDALTDTLIFSLDLGAPAGAAIDPLTGLFSWMPDEIQGPGVYTATVRVTDDGVPSMDDFETITISVNEVNIAPLLDPIGDQSVDELTSLVIATTARDADLPVNTLLFSLDGGAPVGVFINPSTGVLTWTPTEAQGPNIYTVTVRITDDGTPSLGDSESIQIIVDEVNQAPVANAGDDQTVITGDNVQLNGSACSDPDGHFLTYNWVQTGGSPSMSLDNPSFAMPAFIANSAGVFTFTLTVTDTYGLVDSDEVEITVLTVPQADLAVTLNRSGLTTITFTIIVTNSGPFAADGAIVHDELSTLFTHVTWTCSASNGAACTNTSGSGNLLEETIAQLPSGGTVAFIIVGNITVFDDDSNQVVVMVPAGVYDANTSNNVASIARTYRFLLPAVLSKLP